MAGNHYTFLRQQREDTQIKRVTQENSADFAPFLSDPARYTKENSPAVAFGAYLYNEPLGAAELQIGEGYADISSIQVKEDARNTGVGSALLNKAKSYAADLDIRQLHVEFMLGGEEGEPLQNFFRRNTFFPVETGSAILTVRPAGLVKTALFQKIAAAGPLKNTVSMSALPAWVREDLTSRGGRSIPEDRLPWNARGRIQGELSIGCLDKNGLGAFVLVTERGGQLDLSAVYTDSAHANQFLQLVAHVLSKLAEQGVEELYVTANDSMVQNLFERLAADEPELLKKRAAHAMMWRLEDELIEQTAEDVTVAAQAAGNSVDGMEILVPKLMRLMDFVQRQGVPCDLMLSEMPYIMIDNRLDVQYIPIDDRFEEFSLLFSSSIPTNKSEEELREDCANINLNNLYITAVFQDGYVFFRYTLPENEVPVTEEQFLSCVNAFLREQALTALT